ncbi:GGDEF domain-containing protein [Eubacteriales bacterium OttesenSCG-928-M02]|nr:GGDEF domain-containing protein [Eubacteriales bacterium OttesenSCG-928-M02]
MYHTQAYWLHLLNKLSATTDIGLAIKDVLEDLCAHFQFGAGFVYQVDYKGDYHLTKAYQLYPCNLRQVIARGSLLPLEDLQSILHKKVVYFRHNTPKGSLEKSLSQAFQAASMVLVPVLGQEGEIIAMVGLMDRRGEARAFEGDIESMGAVLTVLGTYIKMQIYQDRIQSTQQSLESVLNHMGVDVYVNDFHTHEILYLNASMAAPYGGIDAMLGRPCWQALYDDKTGECDFCPKPHLLDEAGNPTKIYGWDYQRPFDGAWFRVLSAAFPWVDGRMAQVVSSIDITENKTNEEIIRRTAEYDMLTTLPNRYRLNGYMDRQLAHMEDAGRDGYIIFFDLDGFKQVNDTLGHHVGDALLKAVGSFLEESPLTRGRSYRYGGDEFVVLWDDASPGSLSAVMAYLTDGFSTPWQLEQHQVSCGASFGISHYPTDDILSSNLVRNADQAMYLAKKAGSGSVYHYNKGNPQPF